MESTAKINATPQSRSATQSGTGGKTLPAVPVLQQAKEQENGPALQMMQLPDSEVAQPAQLKGDETTRTAALTRYNPIQKKANNTGLPDNLKSGIENLGGYDMSDVKVHYNSAKPAQLQALAYAQGSDIHVGPGQEKHLPHEAWHVVQQKQGRVQATTQMKGNVQVNDDKGLEQEADVMGAKSDGIQLNNSQSHNPGSALGADGSIVQRVIRNNGDNSIITDYDLDALDYYTAQFLDTQITQMRTWSADPDDIAKIAAAIALGPEAVVIPDKGGRAEAPGDAFASLEADVAAGRYVMVSTASNKVRKKSGEDPFEAYSGGVTVAEAVEAAIAGLDLTGSASFKYSRHDFQPTSVNINLQVQLGGSKPYRAKQGDTSSTLVVIEPSVFSNTPRFKLVVQAAHRLSFANSAKIELKAVPPPASASSSSSKPKGKKK
jgi:Tfp pilus assembly protein FimT